MSETREQMAERLDAKAQQAAIHAESSPPMSEARLRHLRDAAALCAGAQALREQPLPCTWTPTEQEQVIARIREVYPIARKSCAWCNSRKSHHFDCPVPDIHALLEMLASASSPSAVQELERERIAAFVETLRDGYQSTAMPVAAVARAIRGMGAKC